MACPRRQQIHAWELAAAARALWHLFSLPEGAAGLDDIIFLDSTVALGTLLRGCSRQRDWNATVAGTWSAAADRGHFLNAFCTPSHLILADWPTRPEQKASELAQLVSRGFARLERAWPAVDFRQPRRRGARVGEKGKKAKRLLSQRLLPRAAAHSVSRSSSTANARGGREATALPTLGRQKRRAPVMRRHLP